METILADLRHALRTMRRNAAFTATALAALALGIGANTAIFTVVNSVLLQPLPYPEPDRMVQIVLRTRQGDLKNMMSIPRFIFLRSQTQAFQEVVAYDSSPTGVNLTGVEDPEQLKAVHVSAAYFSELGARPRLGRVFTAEEDRPNGPRLVVLSDGFWRRRFG